ncbi:ligase-associated DNA damage response DEXH box helicase [Ideonella sp. DXS29W]|uniref:Ligase-associated DNA damage response DEXH box helicase n=1 Tax=Ideonella lacteola TaxID=2984193 RepID=A0ABU9BJV9_9BURK
MPDTADAWFARRGWRPFEFQREVWAAAARADSGLLHATTGAGKTYAVAFGAIERIPQGGQGAPPLSVLWITPMRALAADTLRALQAPLADLRPRATIGLRSGDTPSAERARQDRRWPTVLVTTPESLSLMLTRAQVADELASVQTVIVDEWHELIGSKRGVQVQLALARLRRWNPHLIVWGLSATLGNLQEAMHTLLGHEQGCLVRGRIDKSLVIDTLLPDQPGRFTWGGHLGAQMQPAVVREIEASTGTTLIFTNVRSQAEIWYQLLLEARPDWAGQIALHHGSLDKEVREWVEAGLKAGTLKAVVATSSLDLGVDFLPVERVLQIGSAKGIARLLQRAGRSGHAPGRPSRVTVVPTHTLELVEAVAAREAALAGRVEERCSPDKPLDVLVQHLVTVALGGGFTADELFDEVRSAPAYAALTREEFDWVLAFVERGGHSLHAYPEYHRIRWVEAEGRYRVVDRGIAQRHKLQIGTIVGDTAMKVAWLSGGSLGTIEESFIARLSAGDCFVFAGRVLEYVRTREMTAYVRLAARATGRVVVWNGARMAFSSAMADAVRAVIERAGSGPGGALVLDSPELRAAGPMLETQRSLSRLPEPGELLIERYRSREGHHLFIYPFAGRHVHLGLAGLLAWRLARHEPNTYSLAFSDLGFELLGAKPVDLAALLDGSAWSVEGLLDDVLASLNARELAQRRFREIARVAGLIFTGYPGAHKGLKQLQASSSLFYEVFRKYDAGNRLLSQAENEALSQELELSRLREVMRDLAGRRARLVDLRAASPFALPLMVERLRERLSNEKMQDRLARLLAEAQQRLDASPAAPAPEPVASPSAEAARPPRARRRPIRPIPAPAESAAYNLAPAPPTGPPDRDDSLT